MYEGVKDCQNKIQQNIQDLKEREVILLEILRSREERNNAFANEYTAVSEK